MNNTENFTCTFVNDEDEIETFFITENDIGTDCMEIGDPEFETFSVNDDGGDDDDINELIMACSFDTSIKTEDKSDIAELIQDTLVNIINIQPDWDALLDKAEDRDDKYAHVFLEDKERNGYTPMDYDQRNMENFEEAMTLGDILSTPILHVLRANCAYCGKNLKASYIGQHVQNHHTHVKCYQCPTCKKTFTRNHDLKRHVKLFHSV